MNTWIPRNIKMSYLKSLKLVSSIHSNQITPTQYRRNNLIKKLQLQLACVKARLDGRDHIVTIQRLDKNSETGTRQYVQIPFRVKPWWFTDAEGKTIFELRYGSKRIELVEGKTGIEVESLEGLIVIIEKLILAVGQGELDNILEYTSNKSRPSINK